MGVCTLRVQPTPAIHPCAGFSFQACPSSNRPDFFLFTPSHCLKKKCDTRRPTLVGDVGDPLRGYGAGACATLAADVYPRRPPNSDRQNVLATVQTGHARGLVEGIQPSEGTHMTSPTRPSKHSIATVFAVMQDCRQNTF